MNEDILDSIGYAISDNETCSINGQVRDIDAILEELQGVLDNFSTHSMNESALFLQGQKSMLEIIIKYLKRV